MIKNFRGRSGLVVLTVCGVVWVTLYVIIDWKCRATPCTSRDGCGKAIEEQDSLNQRQNNHQKDPSGIQTDDHSLSESPNNLQNKPIQNPSQNFLDTERLVVRDCVSGDIVAEVSDTVELVPFNRRNLSATGESPQERQKSFQHVFDTRAWGSGRDRIIKGFNASGN